MKQKEKNLPGLHYSIDTEMTLKCSQLWRYEISLLAWRNILYYKKFRIFAWPCNILFLGGGYSQRKNIVQP